MQNPIQILAGDLLLFGNQVGPLHHGVLAALLLAAMVIDVRVRRIPNLLVAAGMLVAIFFHSTAIKGDGFMFAMSGAGIGMLTLFPLYALGAMGAGDVKLMGMIGAFLGVNGVLVAVLATMAAGGVLALGMAAYKRSLPQLLTNLRLMLIQRRIKQMSGESASFVPTLPSIGKMPYAVAICIGTLIQLFLLRY